MHEVSLSGSTVLLFFDFSVYYQETASKKHMAPAETQESGRSIFHPESTSFQVTVLGMFVEVFVFI